MTPDIEELKRKVRRLKRITLGDCIIVQSVYYPYINVGGHNYRVSRVVLFLAGKLDINNKKELALHICTDIRCIKEEHLYKGDHKQNVRDSIEAGTHSTVTQGKKATCDYGHILKNNQTSSGGCKTCQSITNKRKVKVAGIYFGLKPRT